MSATTSPNPEYDPTRYHRYIAQDLEHYRVFVDIEVFMKHVLHIPDNWRQLWGHTIKRIKLDTAFSTAQWEYTHRVPKATLYESLVDMGNAIIRISRIPPDNLARSPRIGQRPLRNGRSGVLGGAMNVATPHTDDSSPHIDLEERDKRRLDESNLRWAQPLLALQIEPSGDALANGSRMLRFTVNGKDPQENHAPPTPSRGETAADTLIHTADEDFPAPGPSRKRTANDLSEPERKSRKVHHRSTPGGGVEGRKLSKPQRGETKRQEDASFRAGRYLLEQFLVSPLCPHANVGIVNDNRIQFYHANHSVILVSSAISFSVLDQTGGLDMFIAIMIAFDRLSLKESGIPHGFGGGELSNNSQKLLASVAVPRGAVRLREGNKLEFGGDEKAGPFTLTLGKLLHREPLLAGRSTVVFLAKSSRWEGVDLVVKIGWPGSGRVAENKFLEEAIKKAEMTGKDKWALRHLPQILYAQDVVSDSDSTHETVASLFENPEFANGEFEYERCTLRIIIQERLYPLMTLTNARTIAQVFLDIICVHRWLYDAGILHQDLSINNIMYRVIRRKVYGVLMDYDLASWKASSKNEGTKDPQEKMGTPPFMAHGLLDGTDPLHLYRHDVESIFHAMLILTTHYEIQAPEGKASGGLRKREGDLPFQIWFDPPSYDTLSAIKLTFFTSLKTFYVSPSFTGFYDWLRELQYAFRNGFATKYIHNLQEELQTGEPGDNDKLPPFDDETLGGQITYSAIIQSARQLKGELKGLIVRYPPPTDAT